MPTDNTGDPAVDSQPDTAVEFLNKDAGKESEQGDQAKAAEAQAPKSTFPSLRLAPIRTRMNGSLGYTITRYASTKEQATIQEMLTLSLNFYATSYIWQPWFSKVDGNIQYLTNILTSSRGGTGNGVPNSSVTGEAAVKLFPYSRFPFEARLSQSESFTGYGNGSPNSQTTALNLIQRYTPLHKLEDYRVSLGRTLSGGAAQSRKKADELSFSANTRRFKQQTHTLQALSLRSVMPGTSTLNNMLVVSDDYRPNAAFSVRAAHNANYIALRDQKAFSNNLIAQSSWFASWLPLQQPYYLVSTLRLYGSNLGVSAGAGSMQRTIDATLSGVYAINQYFRVDAGATAKIANDNGRRSRKTNLASSQSATINYPLPSINFGDLRYTRGVNASFVNRASTGSAPAAQSLSVNPRHALARYMKLGDSNLNLGVQQTLTLSKASRSPDRGSVSHQGSVNWSRSAGQQVSTVILGVSDQRSLIGPKTSFQMVNLQAMLSGELGRNASWHGDLTMQTARSGSEQGLTPFVSSSSARLGYENRRMFNVSRMVFVSDLVMTSASLMPVSPNAQDSQLTWTNRLSYTLGRLQFKVDGNLSHSQTNTNTLIMFSVVRSFGAM